MQRDVWIDYLPYQHHWIGMIVPTVWRGVFLLALWFGTVYYHGLYLLSVGLSLFLIGNWGLHLLWHCTLRVVPCLDGLVVTWWTCFGQRRIELLWSSCQFGYDLGLIQRHLNLGTLRVYTTNNYGCYANLGDFESLLHTIPTYAMRSHDTVSEMGWISQ